MLVEDVVFTKMPGGGSNPDTTITSNYSYNDRVTGAYLGVLTQVTTYGVAASGEQPDPTSTLYDYVWWDDARQSRITHDKDTSLSSNVPHVSTFAYDVNGKLAYVNIKDGQPRNVTFVTDASGQVLSRLSGDTHHFGFRVVCVLTRALGQSGVCPHLAHLPLGSSGPFPSP